MIPEAYWQFVGRWWWLITLSVVAGVAVAVFMVATATIRYQSTALLEINFVRSEKGEIGTSGDARRAQAQRYAVLLNSSEAAVSLRDALETRGYSPQVDANGFPSGPDINVIPPRSRNRGGSDPPYLRVRANGSTSQEAQWLATLSAEVFEQQLNEIAEEILLSIQEFEASQTDLAAESLRTALSDKRKALLSDSSDATSVTNELIDLNSWLLSELRLVLNTLRIETAEIRVAIEADITRLDQAIGDLALEVSTLGDVWQRQLKAPLAVLYTIGGQPEYQMALVRENVLQGMFKDHVTRSAQLSNGASRLDAVTLITKGSSPRKFRSLGLKARYLFVFGAAGGLFLGWLLANLAEQLRNHRARSRGEA